jgi:hypothetical protein
VQRRQFLLLTPVAGASVAGGLWLHGRPAPVSGFPDVAAATRWIDALLAARSVRSLTPWPVPQVLQHLAQSIDFSIDGYPSLRSATFRATAGALAFAVFDRRGRMTHGTTEPIPGAAALDASELAASAEGLRSAWQRFESLPASTPLAPHFAYGRLGRDEYRRAHLMHLADHAREIEIA